MTKTCLRCFQTGKTFGKNRNKLDVLQSWFKDCRNNHMKLWYKLNHDLQILRVKVVKQKARIRKNSGVEQEKLVTLIT